jgi:hypothetical protein
LIDFRSVVAGKCVGQTFGGRKKERKKKNNNKKRSKHNMSLQTLFGGHNYAAMKHLFTLISSINKTDHHDITELLLKVALSTINLTLYIKCMYN